MTTAIEQTVETYGIENWGAGYFDVNRKGNLVVRPAEGDPRSADLKEIIEDLASRGITAPVLVVDGFEDLQKPIWSGAITR